MNASSFIRMFICMLCGVTQSDKRL